MTLKELKQHIDFLIETGHQDNTVIITTKDKSLGARSGTTIQYISSGIDWEHGQIRIEPKQKLVKYGNSRDNGLAPIEHTYEYPSGRKSHLIHCARCGNSLRKKDRYCSTCGQAIKQT